MSYSPQNQNGQATMANSAPTVIASDQSILPFSLNAVGFQYSANNVNSTTTQLAAGATFTGTIEAIPNQPSYSIILFSDQNGTLTINMFIDVAGTQKCFTKSYNYIAGSQFQISNVANGNFFQCTFKNTGSSTTTLLNLNTAYGVIDSATVLNNKPSAIEEIGSTSVTSAMPFDTDDFLPIRTLPQVKQRYGFDKVISNGVDTAMTLLTTGAGQTVNQTAGSLVLVSGTTASSETIIRSVSNWRDAVTLRYSMNLSQRIANNNFFIELVDVIGDNLTYTITSATSITVTKTAHGFTSQNIGQSINVGNFAGTGTFLSGNYVIASVPDANTFTFTVSGFAAGTGTCSLWGWNYHHVLYDSTTVTNAKFGTQRNGWATSDITATINTTASPGHVGVVNVEDGISAYLDQLSASSTNVQLALRAQNVRNVPQADTPLYLQIRSLNGATVPASTTTFTCGFVDVENYVTQQVSLTSVRPSAFNHALPANIQNIPAVTQSGTWNIGTLTSVTAANLAIPNQIIDVASAAITTTTTTSAFTPGFGISYEVNIPVTVVSGTNPTLDVNIEESDDTGTNWFTVYSFPRITATGFYRSPKMPLTGNRVRYVQTLTGTTPSFTRVINRLQASDTTPVFRQIIDRTISLTTLNSSTPSLFTGNGRNISMTINISTATTAPALQLQGSDDAGLTWYNLGTPLTAVASSTVNTVVNNVSPQFIRATVTTMGVTVVAGYVLIRSF